MPLSACDSPCCSGSIRDKQIYIDYSYDSSDGNRHTSDTLLLDSLGSKTLLFGHVGLGKSSMSKGFLKGNKHTPVKHVPQNFTMLSECCSLERHSNSLRTTTVSG
jgi:hypothetical protein